MSVTLMSRLFLRTLREDPADAETASHRLLVRGGYIRRVAPGIYSWLPLGWRVVRRVEQVVREEMDAIGGQEVHLPALLPTELYEASGRLADYGPLLFRLADRRGAPMLLGPTHEEVFTALVKGETASWRDYPVVLYQIQTKYRDEARPRAGVLRAREFLMKDSYSFDLTDEGLRAAYELHRGAYRRIFDRLGLDYRMVSAVSGAMGGSESEEFLAPTPAGEDSFVECPQCGYAANTEAVQLRVPAAADPAGQPAAELLDTPDTPTIETLVARLRQIRPGRSWAAADTLKNVVLTVSRPGSGERELLVVGVPGDREVDLKRLGGQLEPLQAEPATAAEISAVPGLVTGYIGPQQLAALGVRYLVDPLVAPGSAWVTGANEPGRHVSGAVRGRDFTPAGEIGAAQVRDGDPCGRCGSALAVRTGIEVGHIFQLGRKYADLAGLDAVGPDGLPARITMGSYGVGVTRLVAALAEQHHDERGLVWPAAAAPFDVHVVVAGRAGSPAPDAATALAAELDAAGLAVLLDDREVSPGVKFADAELLGVPAVVVVGRGLVNGRVELRDRAAGSAEEVELSLAGPEIIRRARGAAA